MSTSTLIAKMITLCGAWIVLYCLSRGYKACHKRERILFAAYIKARQRRESYVNVMMGKNTEAFDPEYRELLQYEAGALIIYQIRTGNRCIGYECVVKKLLRQIVD